MNSNLAWFHVKVNLAWFPVTFSNCAAHGDEVLWQQETDTVIGWTEPKYFGSKETGNSSQYQEPISFAYNEAFD